jgi:hypothetical protein
LDKKLGILSKMPRPLPSSLCRWGKKVRWIGVHFSYFEMPNLSSLFIKVEREERKKTVLQVFLLADPI